MKPKQRFTKEMRVGGLVLLALVVIVATVFSIGDQRKMFGGKVKYRILFNATGGLYKGDPVLLTGVEVGNVSNIGFAEDLDTQKILVEIAIQEVVAKRIRRDTRARIAAASLVYGKVVELTMGSLSEPEIPVGEFIIAREPTNYGAVVDSTNLMVDDIRQVLWKLNQGEGVLATILNEPLEMRQTLHNLSVSSRRLAEILARVERGEGALGVMLTDTIQVHNTVVSLQKTARDFQKVANSLQDTVSVVGRLINRSAYGEDFLMDLRKAVRSLANVTAKIDSGKGTLGRLVNEDEMYVGLQDVVLGIQSSKMAKWLIQGRRKAGEKERLKNEKEGKAPQGK